MISDVLHDAIVEIERYQTDPAFAAAYSDPALAAEIERVKVAMGALRERLDAPPRALPSVKLTPRQEALLARLRASEHGLFLQGADVRVCHALVAAGLATLEDNGPMEGFGGGSDGERWAAEAVRAAVAP